MFGTRVWSSLAKRIGIGTKTALALERRLRPTVGCATRADTIIGVMLSPEVVLEVGYDGAFSASARNHGVRGELRWSF